MAEMMVLASANDCSNSVAWPGFTSRIASSRIIGGGYGPGAGRVPDFGVSAPAYGHHMTDVQIAGERADLIQEAFRGMKARREADGWVSITGRLDPVPGEALMRALARDRAGAPPPDRLDAG